MVGRHSWYGYKLTGNSRLSLVPVITSVLLSFLLVFGQAIRAETILHPKSNDPKETLVLQILKLAIEHSDQPTKYQFQSYHGALTEARMLQMVQDGSLSIMWAGTQIKYEEELLPIRIPVLKGLLGHRILIIRNGEQAQFNRVTDFAALLGISYGQGRFWGDTQVLLNAGLEVVAPVKYESLFHMLDGARFDAFPRAVHEPWSEIQARPELSLSVEKRILLIYPFAMYFFVSQQQPKLAKDIATGFRKAIDSGQYDQLFFSHPMICAALGAANLQERNVFHLDNPNMSAQTPLDDKSLWLDMADLQHAGCSEMVAIK